jgi:hypothetical protein
MPTWAEIEVATPRCHQRRMIRNGPHGRHFTCYQAMRYVAVGNQWRCPECGTYTPAAAAVARLSAFHMTAGPEAA